MKTCARAILWLIAISLNFSFILSSGNLLSFWAPDFEPLVILNLLILVGRSEWK